MVQGVGYRYFAERAARAAWNSGLRAESARWARGGLRHRSGGVAGRPCASAWSAGRSALPCTSVTEEDAPIDPQFAAQLFNRIRRLKSGRGDNGRSEETDPRNPGLSEAGNSVLRSDDAAPGPARIPLARRPALRSLRTEKKSTLSPESKRADLFLRPRSRTAWVLGLSRCASRRSCLGKLHR